MGTIESVTITSRDIDFGSWAGSTWDGVLDDGSSIQVVEDASVNFGSMVMDPMQISDSAVVSASGRLELSPFPDGAPDTSTGQLSMPARLWMTYSLFDPSVGTASTMEWRTGIASDNLTEENWLEAVATVDYLFDSSFGSDGIYRITELRVETVPEPTSILNWIFGACIAVLARRRQIRNKNADSLSRRF